MTHGRRLATLLAVALAALAPTAGRAQPALAGGGTLRIAMTATDVPTTTGQPNNGYEGLRFLGYPVFESLVLWDLSQGGAPAGLRPGLAEQWEQDAADPKTWIFHLRPGVTFHDGSRWDADAALWTLDRFFRNDAPQADPQGAATVRGRVNVIAGYRRVDDLTIAIETTRPLSYFPYLAPYVLFASPASWEGAGRDWARQAMAPAGTGPFRMARLTPRVSAELTRNDGYWDAARRAHVERVLLLPIPDATARLAALRSGQVDWVEVPPPDAIPSLRSAGFTVTTSSYPHVWPWVFAAGRASSPVSDVRVRRALNYCIDRAGVVALLNGTAEPAVGFFKPADAAFGEPEQRYGLDPARGRALLAEAGFSAARPLRLRVGISNSGSGQMLPLPMNEFLQASLRENCGVEVSFDVVEWNTLLAGLRFAPDAPQWLGADALNISLVSSDASQMARWFLGANASPAGSNAGHWGDPRFDAAVGDIERGRDPVAIAAALARAHERLVDDAPWLYVVHDLNPRAFAPRVRGYIPANSWFNELTAISVQ